MFEPRLHPRVWVCVPIGCLDPHTYIYIWTYWHGLFKCVSGLFLFVHQRILIILDDCRITDINPRLNTQPHLLFIRTGSSCRLGAIEEQGQLARLAVHRWPTFSQVSFLPGHWGVMNYSWVVRSTRPINQWPVEWTPWTRLCYWELAMPPELVACERRGYICMYTCICV